MDNAMIIEMYGKATDFGFPVEVPIFSTLKASPFEEGFLDHHSRTVG